MIFLLRQICDRFALRLFIIVSLLIAVLSLYPISPAMVRFAGGDKLGHFFAFALWGFLLAVVLRRRCLRRYLLFVVSGGAFLFGGLIEIIQPFTGRFAESADLIANVCGGFAGALILIFIKTLSSRKNE